MKRGQDGAILHATDGHAGIIELEHREGDQPAGESFPPQDFGGL